MKATNEQQETIKEITLKTLDFYIITQNKNRSEIIASIKKRQFEFRLKTNIFEWSFFHQV